MTLVLAASPLMAIESLPLLAPARLTARRMASPTASASTIAFSLMAFCGVGSAAYASTRYWPPAIASSISLTDEVVISSPSNGRYLRWKRNIILFPFQVFTPESADPAGKRWPLYNSALLNRPCGPSHNSAVCRAAPRELLRGSRKGVKPPSEVNHLCCAMSNYRPGDALSSWLRELTDTRSWQNHHSR